jgi:protein TonB
MHTVYDHTHDRLGLTLFLAFLLHAWVIYAFDFLDMREAAPIQTTRLEITLAKNPAIDAPDDFDYIAQASQEGGGESDELSRPQDENMALSPDTSTGEAPIQTAPLPTPEITEETRVVSTSGQEMQTLPIPDEAVQPEEDAPPADVVFERMDIARLEALNYQQREAYARRDRIKTINARTREAVYATYMNDWVDRVERFGNLNYPDESRINKLYGDVLLEVLIRADGSVQNINIVRSSGKVTLDDAAVRIVQLSAPYPPFSEALRKELDALRIMRTFRFSKGNKLTSQ